MDSAAWDVKWIPTERKYMVLNSLDYDIRYEVEFQYDGYAHISNQDTELITPYGDEYNNIREVVEVYIRSIHEPK